MSTFKHGSWGRTRGPKSLVNTPGGSVETLANTNALKGVEASNAGYATENQRYLHVLVEDTNVSTPTVVEVYGYCHAFQRWFSLPVTQAAGWGTNASPDASSIAISTSSNNPAAQTPDERSYRRYDITGIDKVAFVTATAANVNVFAACSTF